jgi:hypothetical protein
MVVADIDNGTATTGGSLDGNTKITVKSIKIESVNSDGSKANSIATSGTLNLATGVWTATTANVRSITRSTLRRLLQQMVLLHRQ